MASGTLLGVPQTDEFQFEAARDASSTVLVMLTAAAGVPVNRIVPRRVAPKSRACVRMFIFMCGIWLWFGLAIV